MICHTYIGTTKKYNSSINNDLLVVHINMILSSTPAKYQGMYQTAKCQGTHSARYQGMYQTVKYQGMCQTEKYQGTHSASVLTD